MANITIVHQISPEETQAVHIVYVHGFRGDHTTFQTFPSDLHNHLLPDIPGLQTWVYPTYKSAKPLSFAVANFLSWLKSLPPGPVLLAGHSMGGLLVAEAATSPSPVARRITGLIAFDTPYLGMHPHVVVSGIASLFQKKEEEVGKDQKHEKHEEKRKAQSDDPGPPAPSAQGMSSEKTVNDEGIVNFVTSADAYPGSRTDSSGGLSHASTSNSQLHDSGKLSPTPSSPPSTSSTPSKAQSSASAGGSSIVTSAMSFFKVHADDPFIRFLTKHSDAPIAAVSRWVVEYFEFGWAMFDYPALLDRYEQLENWEGDWVCFWSVTGGEAMEEDAGMGDGERPPTPLKVKRRLSPGERIANEFEKAMRTATEKAEKKREKELEKRAKKERNEREKERRKKEEEQERQRKKEEEAQERERKEATDLLEKERKRVEKESKAKEDAEQKEGFRIAKEEGKQAKKAAKPVKEKPTNEDEAVRQSSESENSIVESSSQELDAITDTPVISSTSLPDVVIEGDDTPSKPDRDGDNTIEDDKQSVTGSFQTALETHNPDSIVPSPARSLVASPTLPSSRPPSPGRASAYHFITLPGVLHPRKKKHWLKVRIAGVEDEVAAHCGLFIRAQNLDYDRFVERVGKVVKSWVL